LLEHKLHSRSIAAHQTALDTKIRLIELDMATVDVLVGNDGNQGT
jgi:hypothetical protein